MPDTMTIGRTTQFGPEVTPGTAPAGGATKQITDLTVTLDPTFGVTEVRGTGRRFDAAVNPDGQESITGKIGGGLGYNSFVYPASMIWGGATISTPTNGINSRLWTWTPALTGSIPPQSFDIEMGDANDAERTLYSILQDIGVDFTRAQVAPSGKLLAQALQKAAAGTSFTGMTNTGISAIPIVQVLPVQWSVFMDDTAANIGVTQLLRCFHAAFGYTSAFIPFFPINSSLTTYAGVADDPAVQATCLLELMKDAVGEALWIKARAGSKKYIRFQATSGQYVDNYAKIVSSASITSGTFTLTYKGQTTAAIAFNAAGSAILTAFTNLSTVGTNNATITPTATLFNTATTFQLALAGALANDPAQITANFASLVGGTPTLTMVQLPYQMTIDMCASIKTPGPQADNSGLRTRQWDFIIVEDPAWNTGQGMQIKVQNALAAL